MNMPGGETGWRLRYNTPVLKNKVEQCGSHLAAVLLLTSLSDIFTQKSVIGYQKSVSFHNWELLLYNKADCLFAKIKRIILKL